MLSCIPQPRLRLAPVHAERRLFLRLRSGQAPAARNRARRARGKSRYRRRASPGCRDRPGNVFPPGAGGGIGGGLKVEGGYSTGSLPNAGVDVNARAGARFTGLGVGIHGKYDFASGSSSAGGTLGPVKGTLSSSGSATIAGKAWNWCRSIWHSQLSVCARQLEARRTRR